MNEKKDFDPVKDIVFSIVQKLRQGKQLPMNEPSVEVMDEIPKVIVPSQQHEQQQNLGLPSNSVSILFDFNDSLFSQFVSENKITGYKFEVVKDLTQLTQSLRLHVQEKTYLFLNYEQNPKAMEQLIPQIKSKFAKTNICIVLKNKNMEGTLKTMHSFLQHFLSIPLRVDDFKRVLQ